MLEDRGHHHEYLNSLAEEIERIPPHPHTFGPPKPTVMKMVGRFLFLFTSGSLPESAVDTHGWLNYISVTSVFL